MARATDAQKAERLNRARTLLRKHAGLPEAAEYLARGWSISKRQAYRYLQQAQQLKQPVPVGDAKVSFTVKLSRRLVERLRTYAASTGLTLSEIVSRALQAVLHRGGGRG
jgi:predicted DNA-binding transcriptional regulator YafY